MRLVLVGPPGSGKGTQAEWLCERLGLASIGTGQLLREAIRSKSPAGIVAEPLLAQGLLAPDAMVNELVAELFRTERPENFLMDGYPRTYSQAVSFDALLHQEYLKLDAVVNLTIPDDEVVRRIGGRRICSNAACAAVYNLGFRPPKADGRCSKCSAELTLRDDDREATIRQRLNEFHKNTAALIEYYRRAGLSRDVNAMEPADAVYEAIVARLT